MEPLDINNLREQLGLYKILWFDMVNNNHLDCIPKRANKLYFDTYVYS